jgi:hypothetical protein
MGLKKKRPQKPPSKGRMSANRHAKVIIVTFWNTIARMHRSVGYGAGLHRPQKAEWFPTSPYWVEYLSATVALKIFFTQKAGQIRVRLVSCEDEKQ